MSNSPPNWTPAQQQTLEQVELAAEIIRRASPPSDKDSWWQKLIAAPAFSTLLTIVGTGVIGTLLSGVVQDRMKEKELALATYQENLTAQIETIKKTYALMGEYVAGSEDLIAVSQEVWRNRLEEAKRYEERYNAADAQWRKDAETLGFLLSYHHPGQADVRMRWIATRKAIEGYNTCAVAYHAARRHASRPRAEEADPCAKERAAIEKSFGELSAVLDASRREVMKRWGILDRQEGASRD